MVRTDLNLNNSNKFSFNYMQLDSSSDNQLSGSTSAGIGRRSVQTDHMNYAGSNYQILENRKTTTGELNSVIGSTMANSLRVSYSSSDESRPQSDVLFPFVDILQGGSAYISFGSEPFTPNNELRYKSFEVKNDFTKFSDQARAHLRRPRREVRLGQRVLQLLQAGRLGLQQPGRLLHRRARRAGEPEPHGLAGVVALPGALHEHPRPRQAEPAAARRSTAAPTRRTCGVPRPT